MRCSFLWVCLQAYLVAGLRHGEGSHNQHHTATAGNASQAAAAKAADKTALKVAIGIVAPFGCRKSKAWRDAFAVLAHSVKDISAKSSHKMDVLAIVPQTLPEQDKERKAFENLGIKFYSVPIPVPLDQVVNKQGAEVLKGSLGENEQLKYYGAALEDYDRSVVLDADMIFLKPIDELLEATTGQYAMAGVYDHEMDMPSSVFPPVNSGFLTFKPSKADFDRIVSIYRKGNIDGNGWDGSGTGWTYGTGSQGILSYYYNQVKPGVEGFSKDAPTKGVDYPGQAWTKQPASSRFLPQDRSVYNVVDTKPLQVALKGGHTQVDRVKVFHFAGGSCPKPWTCNHVSDDELCDKMTARWWELRKAVQEKQKLAATPQCEKGVYTPLPIPDA